MRDARELPGTGPSPASARLRHVAPMALWWAWFTAYFFPDPVVSLGDFGRQTVAMRAALMAGFVVAAAAFALPGRRAAASRPHACGAQAAREGEAFHNAQTNGAPAVSWGSGLVACCLSMSTASLAVAFAGLGAVGTALPYALLSVGGVGCGWAFLLCYAKMAEHDLLCLGRWLAAAALGGGAARLALLGLTTLTPSPLATQGVLARGRNPRGIAEKLDISVNTVRTHIHHIYDKCRVHSDQELIDLVEAGDVPSS